MAEIKKLLTIAALLLFSVDVFASVSDMTLKMLETKEQLITCDTAKSCTKIGFEYSVYLGHPDNAKDLENCAEDGKCYEAMMDITMYLLTDHLDRTMQLE